MTTMRRLRGVGVLLLGLQLGVLLAGCAGTPRLPQCHGVAVPINAKANAPVNVPGKLQDSHGQ